MASGDSTSQGAVRALQGNTQQRRFSASRTTFMQSRAKPISHECLREHAFFKDRDPKLLELLLESITVQVFMPGDTIVKEGEHGDTMYFMYRGEVDVLVGADEKRVAQLKDGSLFGEMALLGNGSRAATIRAASVCDCRVIDSETFHLCLQRFPAERAYFYQLAKERLAALNKTVGVKCASNGLVIKPPSEATQKFRRNAHAVLAGLRMKGGEKPKENASLNQTGNSISSSRTTTCSDSFPAMDTINSNTSSRVSTMEEDLSLKCQAATGSRTSTMEDISPKCNAAPARRRSVGKPMDVHPVHSVLEQSMEVASPRQRPGRRSSAPAVSRVKTQTLCLDHFLDNVVFQKKVPTEEPVVPPASPRTLGSKRAHSRKRSLPDVEPDYAKACNRWSGLSCDTSKPAHNGRRMSDSSHDWTPRLPASKSMAISKFERPQSSD